MPDISKCYGNDCPLKEKCYRYTCTPSLVWQSYSDYTYCIEIDKIEKQDKKYAVFYKCEYFMEIYEK